MSGYFEVFLKTISVVRDKSKKKYEEVLLLNDFPPSSSPYIILL